MGTAGFRHTGEGVAGQGQEGTAGAKAWRPDGSGGGPSEVAVRPAPPALAGTAGRPPGPSQPTVLRLHPPPPGGASWKRRALGRLRWGRSARLKSWDPGCQHILPSSSPRLADCTHKGSGGGVRARGERGRAPGSPAAAAPRAWLSEAGPTGPSAPGLRGNTQKLPECQCVWARMGVGVLAPWGSQVPGPGSDLAAGRPLEAPAESSVRRKGGTWKRTLKDLQRGGEAKDRGAGQEWGQEDRDSGEDVEDNTRVTGSPGISRSRGSVADTDPRVFTRPLCPLASEVLSDAVGQVALDWLHLTGPGWSPVAIFQPPVTS